MKNVKKKSSGGFFMIIVLTSTLSLDFSGYVRTDNLSRIPSHDFLSLSNIFQDFYNPRLWFPITSH